MQTRVVTNMVVNGINLRKGKNIMKVYEFQITYICSEAKLLVLAESKDEAIKLAAESADVPKKVAKNCLVKVYKEPQVVAHIEEDE